jgi:hypothetical protein
MAPEYASRGQLTEKADVFSFGVVVLEIVSGRRNIEPKLAVEDIYLIELVLSFKFNSAECFRLCELVRAFKNRCCHRCFSYANYVLNDITGLEIT